MTPSEMKSIAMKPLVIKPNVLWSLLWVVLGSLYFIVPLLATLEFAMRSCRPQTLYCLSAFEKVFRDPAFFRTFLFSFEMAVLTIIASIALVVPTAYWVHLRLPRLRPIIEFITLMPFVIPAIVLVFGLIKAYSGGPLYITNFQWGTNTLLVGGYVVLALPYMYRAVDTGLMAIDVRSLTEAAQSLGASWWTIVTRVILPNLRVALLSGAFLTLATVIGEFTLATFLVGLSAFGPYMSQVGQNRAYESSALALISFGLTWASMGLIQILSRGTPGQGPVGGGR